MRDWTSRYSQMELNSSSLKLFIICNADAMRESRELQQQKSELHPLRATFIRDDVHIKYKDVMRRADYWRLNPRSQIPDRSIDRVTYVDFFYTAGLWCFSVLGPCKTLHGLRTVGHPVVTQENKVVVRVSNFKNPSQIGITSSQRSITVISDPCQLLIREIEVCIDASLVTILHVAISDPRGTWLSSLQIREIIDTTSTLTWEVILLTVHMMELLFWLCLSDSTNVKSSNISNS